VNNYLDSIQTPSVLIDMEKVKSNLCKIEKISEKYSVKIRPHIKTHKMIEFAKMQMMYGAEGITCAKISEAEVMAKGGIDDIFIAYPIIGDEKIDRVLQLNQILKRLIVGIDSAYGAKALANKAASLNQIVEVRLEVDTGAKRTGVSFDDVVELALEIKKYKNLNLTGIYTFKSLIFNNEPTKDAKLAGKEEGQLLEKIRRKLEQADVNIEEISAGSSPTGEAVASTNLVSEIRPGTNIFNDYMLVKEGVCKEEDIAAYIVATVVSTPNESYAVIDGGNKAISTDMVLNVAPYYHDTYAKVVGRDDLIIRRLNEEHGIIESKTGKTNLKIGEKILLYPGHVCTTINLYNNLYIVENDMVRKEKIDARGMLY